MKSTLKWQKTSTIYPTDHIISSTAREVGYRGFTPEYENVKNVNMRFIMSNEYMRLWFKERDLYVKENYAKAERAKNDINLKRGYVQRMMTNPKKLNKELPIIELKRFQNILSKIDTRRTEEEKAKICERYKKTVVPTVLTRYKPACAATTKPKSPEKGNGKDELEAPPNENNTNTTTEINNKNVNKGRKYHKHDGQTVKCQFHCYMCGK